MKVRKMIVIVIVIIGVYVIYAAYSFGLFQSDFNISAAEKCIVNHKDSFETSMHYIENYTKQQKMIFFQLSKGKVSEQTYSGNDEELIIEGKENENAFDVLSSAGVKSIEYNRENGYYVFIFQSDLSKSKGVLYCNRNTSDLPFNDLPYEIVSLNRIDSEYNWYFYSHETKN